MRLLRCNNTDDFYFTKDLIGDDEEIPPYAILSHTWQEGEEVTYDDLMRGSGKSKAGYNKMKFCAQQAKRDGLNHFWVDTCCIQKGDHVELQDAINSMFNWYRNAVKCYVFLSDVSVSEQRVSCESYEFPWELAFRESRWFARGWTLQELLAPSAVEFFSYEGEQLGDKKSLEQQIHEITGIPMSALQGAPLHEFDVEERLLWTKNRRTTRKEDKAYSLLGIFSVYMVTNYGEGEENAFRRLREEIHKSLHGPRKNQGFTQIEKEDQECIKSLRITDPRHDKKRIETTKGGLLDDSYRWVLDNADFQRWRNDPQSRLLWIKGDPGKGKTMLLCGIINELEKQMSKSDILSYFFCQATDPRINTATTVLQGLLYLLVDRQPLLISHIRKKLDYAGQALFKDANAWIALTEILTNVLQDPSLRSIYLIIDALDECIVDLPKLLQFVTQHSASSRVKWILSSRNLADIEEQLERAGKVRLSLELNAESVSMAVSNFIEQRVSQLAQKKKYDNKTRDTVLERLASNSNNTFLWVALVCQNLDMIPRRNVIKNLNTFPPGLDSLYERMIQQIYNSGDDTDLCKEILALVATVHRPITLAELATFVTQIEDIADDLEAIREIVNICGSFLTIREDTIYFVHQSAKDFLLTEAYNELFPFGMGETHYMIFSRSLEILSKTLRRDIYSLNALGYPIEQVEDPDLDPLAASRYSCIYWVDHLCRADTKSSARHRLHLQDGGTIHEFLKKNYLYWLESLSLCKSIPKGIVSMAKLENLVLEQDGKALLAKFVQDARRFIMYHKGAIESSPLQTYVSALLFSPTHSLIREAFKREESDWIILKPAIENQWSPCLQTLEGHTIGVTSVVFSHNSSRLASVSYDDTIKIWDTNSGECLQTLKGHSSGVKSATFSRDSAQLASGSLDRTIKVWDTSTGECLQTFEGHISSSWSVAFSHDSAMVASASNDKTVKIWNVGSGECLQVLNSHGSSVRTVAFSHNSSLLALALYDKTIKICDTSSGECLQTIEDYSADIMSLAFSHDSTQLASALINRTIKIWDTSSGECLRTLRDRGSNARSVAFSHDLTRLASGMVDRTVKVWNSNSGECVQTFKGHRSSVTSVTFSHDSAWLASASLDRTVKVWDAGSSGYFKSLEGHSSGIISVTFSPNSAWLASASEDETVKIWDSNGGECLQTLKGHSSLVWSIAFSHDSALVASASGDKTVKIWDISSGECLQTLNGHAFCVRSVAFSHDSALLASASEDMMVKLWNTSSGECLQTLKGHISKVVSVIFSHNSARIASTSDDKTVRVWDVSNGKCVHTLEGHDTHVISVTFSHDSARLASASSDRKVKIWDAGSGECLQTITTGRIIHRLSFDISSSYLHTSIGTIVLSSSITLQPDTVPEDLQYSGISLSHDNIWIKYDSENLVWLPSEYRPLCCAVSGKTIGIGAGTGRLLICKIELDTS